jgi:hypothetical protein
MHANILLEATSTENRALKVEMYVNVVLQATSTKDKDACLDSIDYVHTTHC